MHESFVYLLAFGSNLGDRTENLGRGFLYLKEFVSVLRESSWKRTEPLASREYDVSSHEYYLNAMCEVSSQLPPTVLYGEISRIEDKVGHSRNQKWEPRHLDIDILFCGVGKTIESSIPFFVRETGDGLCVPHNGFWQRDFLVEFLSELDIKKESLLRHSRSFSFFER